MWALKLATCCQCVRVAGWMKIVFIYYYKKYCAESEPNINMMRLSKEGQHLLTEYQRKNVKCAAPLIWKRKVKLCL